MEKQVISIIERVTGEVYPDANETSNSSSKFKNNVTI